MKKIVLFLALLPAIGGLGGCSNDNETPPPNPVDLLPPATQTGENTFGCLLDGEVFLPGSGINPLDCVYQFVDGGYYFALQANKRDDNYSLIGISIGTIHLEIQENVTYELTTKTEGNAVGGYFFKYNWKYTDEYYVGELTITKLDFNNHIVSGTFWFDIKDSQGKIHHIREGRFDMQFTQ